MELTIQIGDWSRTTEFGDRDCSTIREYLVKNNIGAFV
jgi:hypothetical protein